MKWFKSIFSSDYGMLGVLILLCGFFSWITLEEQNPEGSEAAFQLYENIQNEDKIGVVLIAGRKTKTGNQFVEKLKDLLINDGWTYCHVVGVTDNVLREMENVF